MCNIKEDTGKQMTDDQFLHYTEIKTIGVLYELFLFIKTGFMLAQMLIERSFHLPSAWLHPYHLFQYHHLRRQSERPL